MNWVSPNQQASEPADVVVAALIPPQARTPDSSTIPPLPMVDIQKLSTSGTMHYAIARTDTSGRIKDRSALESVGWHEGDRLDMTVRSGFMAIHSEPNGLLTIQQNGAILIPSAARHRCGIRAGDRVLLATVPQHSLLLIYGVPALDQMVTLFHSASEK